MEEEQINTTPFFLDVHNKRYFFDSREQKFEFMNYLVARAIVVVSFYILGSIILVWKFGWWALIGVMLLIFGSVAENKSIDEKFEELTESQDV